MNMTRFSGRSDGKKSLLDLMREEGCPIHADCGGRGTCGKCRVRFVTDAPEPLDVEKELISERDIREGFRLACLTKVSGDFTVETDASEEAMEAETIAADMAEMPSSQAVALDIGTTTLAAALLDIDRKKIVKAAARVNHQRSFGADVISRIQASVEGKGDELKRLIREDVEKLLSEIGADSAAPMIISANTTMQHLWQGLSCETLGAAPFTPVDISCRTVDGCTLLPGISTYVGADIVSGIVATGMDVAENPCILIDLGTNGEIVIGNRDKILAAGTAAGPAFEGGNISCGMAGVPGAVCGVTIEEGEVNCETIGDGPPSGLCGTGVIEVVYELLKADHMDDTGLFSEDIAGGGFEIADRVVFTQGDVREVQLAKAAIRAGLEVLMCEYGIGYADVDTLYLAGGFGMKIDLKKACGIGLLPRELLERTEAVGNTSLKGAAMFAFDEEVRERFVRAASDAREISLADSGEFQEEYLKQMYFDAAGLLL